MRLLKNELKKLLWTRYFLIAITIGIACTIINAISAIRIFYHDYQVFLEQGQTSLDLTQAQNLYNSWIGGGLASDFGSGIFFAMFPLMVTIPVCLNIHEELYSGYLAHVFSKAGRRLYLRLKTLAVFLIGGCTAIIPMLISLIIIAMVIPSVGSGVIYRGYYRHLYGSFLSGIAYSHPLLYVVAYLAVDFLFGGFFSLISLTTAFYTRRRILIALV